MGMNDTAASIYGIGPIPSVAGSLASSGVLSIFSEFMKAVLVISKVQSILEKPSAEKI
jgi:ApbE superfamily uncharacterized protein (UPF0280 family)